MKRRIFALLLAMALLIPGLPGRAFATEFWDVPQGAYFEEAVDWAVENLITFGVSDSQFAPDLPCTRAQVVTFLWRYDGQKLSQAGLRGQSPFADVVFLEESTRPYFQAILWAYESEITTGKAPDRFAPFDTVTRGEFVTFLWRLAGKPEPQGENPFRDVAADAFYTEPVLWAVEKGITTGTGEGTFSPYDTCTRAHVVTFLHRYDNAVKEDARPKPPTVPINPGDITVPTPPEGVELQRHPLWESAVEAELTALPAYDTAATLDNAGKILQVCDPDGYLFLRWDETDFAFYEEAGFNVVDMLSTAVHEVFHGFCGSAANGQRYQYLGDGFYVVVDESETYDSEEMTVWIPEDLRTFRFEEYVAPGCGNMDSNINGIYGLLNEFNAYWTDMNHSVAMFDYFCAQEQMLNTWRHYIIGCENSRMAYAEFRYYILTYLLYAKENYPEVYQGLLENDALRYAFRTVEQNYASAIETYEYQLWQLANGQIPGTIENVEVTDSFVWFGGKGIGRFTGDYSKLITAMEEKEYVQMMETFCG